MPGEAAWRPFVFRGGMVLLGMAFGAFLALGATAMGEETYTASADIFVTAEGGPTPSDVAEAAALAEQQADNFAELATRDVVLRPAIEELGLDTTPSQLSDHVDATVPPDTSIISISVSDESPARAAAIANALAASLTQAVEALTVSASGKTPLALQSIEEASVPSSPTSPRPFLNLAIGILAGMCAAVALLALADTVGARGSRKTAFRDGAPS